MAWRVAESLGVLLNEINLRSPTRSKASDGSIGDAAHASRDSDHNPWVKDGAMGVVTARDFTNDPAHGFDSSEFADWLRARCKSGAERRVKYVISDRRIASERENWAWRAYTGTNPHEHHVHVSVLSTKNRYDSLAAWGWLAAAHPPKPAPPTPPKESIMPETFNIDDSKVLLPHTYTAADKKAYGEGLTDAAGSWSSILRFPPFAARLRREIANNHAATSAQLQSVQGQLAEVRAQLAAITATLDPRTAKG